MTKRGRMGVRWGMLPLFFAAIVLPGCTTGGGTGAEDPGGASLAPIATGMDAERSADVASPEAIVGVLYAVISGPADQERDWDRFRSLFLPDDARLIVARGQTPDGTVEEGAQGTDVEGFIEIAGANYRQNGFWEREIWSRTERFGNVAHVFSTYESRVGVESSDPVSRGINSIQLLRHEGRWWIANVVWDVETPGNPIPDSYLPD